MEGRPWAGGPPGPLVSYSLSGGLGVGPAGPGESPSPTSLNGTRRSPRLPSTYTLALAPDTISSLRRHYPDQVDGRCALHPLSPARGSRVRRQCPTTAVGAALDASGCGPGETNSRRAVRPSRPAP